MTEEGSARPRLADTVVNRAVTIGKRGNAGRPRSFLPAPMTVDTHDGGDRALRCVGARRALVYQNWTRADFAGSNSCVGRFACFQGSPIGSGYNGMRGGVHLMSRTASFRAEG
jgi:hypothetical protein